MCNHLKRRQGLFCEDPRYIIASKGSKDSSMRIQHVLSPLRLVSVGLLSNFLAYEKQGNNIPNLYNNLMV